jgi:2'-5' RNA ligase
MKRLFAAIKIHPDAEFLATYQELKHELGHERIKWVEGHNFHVTLKFFGETEEQKIPEIGMVLKNRATMTPSFAIRLSGLGIFGSSYAPKVIWVGIDPYMELSMLIKNLHGDLAAIGFESDRQNPVPHLTLGRIKFLKDKVIFNRITDKLKTISSPLIRAGEIILYESILRREGPEYLILEKFPLT